MDSIVARQSDLGRLTSLDESGDHDSARIFQLSAWMMVLGTVRLVCAAGDYASAFLAINGPAWPSLNLIGRFLRKLADPLLPGNERPLVLGLVIRRSGSRVLPGGSDDHLPDPWLRRCASRLVEGLSLRSGSTLLVGSFGVSRLAVHRSSWLVWPG